MNYKYNLGKSDPHIPNKDEGKLLRKIMSQTGMSEIEVRNIKKYRKLLSNQARIGESAKTNHWYKSEKRLWKKVTRKTGLVKTHPVSKYVYNKLLISNRNYIWGFYKKHPFNLSKKELVVLDSYDLTPYDNL